MYVFWFNFILGLNYISLCLKLVIIHYHTQKQTEIKFKPSIKLRTITYITEIFVTSWMFPVHFY